MKNTDAILNFIGYFESEIAKVSKIDNPLYKKILFASMIDALGTARFPSHNTDQKMISFLLDSTKLADLNRVSIVQLNLFLNHILSDQEKKSSILLQLVSQKIAEMQPGHIYQGTDIDPYYNQLDKKATSKEKRILKSARYVDLFYAYRNELVHGFKEPAYGMEISDDGLSPYYHSYISKPWQLVFPAPFFQLLCTEALNGLKRYLEDKNIDPYERYEFGDMWIKSRKLDKMGSFINRGTKIKYYGTRILSALLVMGSIGGGFLTGAQYGSLVGWIVFILMVVFGVTIHKLAKKIEEAM